jgi:DNA-binding MarR family transcriptional regulator
MCLSELARHFGRALSTLSVMLAALEDDGLLARQRDGGDARRALIWLSPAGQQALQEALDVLDTHRLATAAATLGATHAYDIVNADLSCGARRLGAHRMALTGARPAHCR